MNNVLVLHLTKEFFNMVMSGEKRVEYREYKPYWISRLAKLHKYIRFVLGYTSKYSFLFSLDFVELITFGELPDYAKDFFMGIPVYSDNFYAIHFSNCKMVNK